MSKVENAFGKIIQIRNTSAYCELTNKMDVEQKISTNILPGYINNICTLFSSYITYDKDKLNLFSLLYPLSNISGSNQTLNYINQKLSEENKISRDDIFLYNIRKIFPNINDLFSPEVLKEFMSLVHKEPLSNETKIIDMCYDINKYASINKEASIVDRVSIINKIINIIGDGYRSTGLLELPSEVKEANYNEFKLGSEDRDELDNIANNSTKESIIEKLNNFNIHEEEKGVERNAGF